MEHLDDEKKKKAFLVFINKHSLKVHLSHTQGYLEPLTKAVSGVQCFYCFSKSIVINAAESCFDSDVAREKDGG